MGDEVMHGKRVIKSLLVFALTVILVLQNNFIYQVNAADQGKVVTILFTHDMHDNLLPFKAKEDGTIVNLGGYARLKTAINEQKAIDPNALLVDAGDFSMGTPFQTIYQSDAPELRMLGLIGYDAVTLGNHEFDYRPDGLTGSLNAAMKSGDQLPQIIQSNMSFPVDKKGNMSQSLTDLKTALKDYGVKDYSIIEKNGIKIGIFGLMGEEAASMAPKSEVVFTNKIEAAKRIVKQLKQENVDMILCLSHTGTNPDKAKSEDEILAKKIPEINVIISGHTHSKLSKPIIVGNTVIASVEDYGKYLGVVKMEQKQNTWQLGTYKLVQINDSLQEDSTVSQKIDEYKNIVQAKYFDKFGMKYDDVVAKSDFEFKTPEEIFAKHEEATIGNLISDAYLYAVKKAEGENYKPIAAVVVPCGTIRGTIFKGNITTADAFSISSLGIGKDGMPGYPLISVYLTGKELKTICEVDASIAPIMGDAQLYTSGLNFTFNPNRLIFNKVTKANLVSEDNSLTKIDNKKLYRVVCGLYSAQMLSVVGEKSFGLMSLTPKNEDGKPIKDFEANIIYDNSQGGKKELKEWFAVVQYLQSFDKVESVPQIPSKYEKKEGRKIIDNSKNLFKILENPNAISTTVYIVVPILVVLIITVITKIIRRFVRRRARKIQKK